MSISSNFALVTGASSGIGKQITFELAKRHYNILAVSNQEKELNELKKELRLKHDVQVLVLVLDLAEPPAATKLFDFCTSKQIEVEVLVNNAGTLIAGNMYEQNLLKIKTLLNLHINTPVELCRLFADQMIKRKRGYILNVSSISAAMPYPIISLYGPSKSFLRNFTKGIGIELKPKGVKVCCLLPGATETPLYNSYNLNLALAKKIGLLHSPEYVAHKAVKGLFSSKREVIPGLVNRLILLLVGVTPLFVIRIIYNNIKA